MICFLEGRLIFVPSLRIECTKSWGRESETWRDRWGSCCKALLLLLLLPHKKYCNLVRRVRTRTKRLGAVPSVRESNVGFGETVLGGGGCGGGDDVSGGRKHKRLKDRSRQNLPFASFTYFVILCQTDFWMASALSFSLDRLFSLLKTCAAFAWALV